MTAIIELNNKICVVHHIGRKGFGVKIDTYCHEEHSASSVNVIQVPDDIIKHKSLCPTCKKSLEILTAAMGK